MKTWNDIYKVRRNPPGYFYGWTFKDWKTFTPFTQIYFPKTHWKLRIVQWRSCQNGTLFSDAWHPEHARVRAWPVLESLKLGQRLLSFRKDVKTEHRTACVWAGSNTFPFPMLPMVTDWFRLDATKPTKKYCIDLLEINNTQDHH